MDQRPKTRGIFCIETVWFDASDGTSVRPMLELLRNSYLNVPFIHRNAVTKDEFFFHICKWTELKPSDYPILYLGYHGEAGSIYLADSEEVYDDENRIEFYEISQRLEGKGGNRVIHFSSCSTLDLSSKESREFLKMTGASAVSGYKKEIDWMESAALDILFLEQLQYRGKENLTTNVMQTCKNNLMKPPYSELRKSLGFQIMIRK